MILIDTSAWVAFFRGDRAAVDRLDPLIADGLAAVSGPVYAEVLSGAPTRPTMERLKTLLASLEWLSEPPDVWERIAEARFALARRGHQASLVDLHIAVTADAAGHALLTRDTDFVRIREALTLEIALF